MLCLLAPWTQHSRSGKLMFPSLLLSASLHVWVPEVRRKKERTCEMIKWMIHLRKQISVAAQSLTPERKINSVERAGTDTTPEEQRRPDNSNTYTHKYTQTHKQQLKSCPSRAKKENIEKWMNQLKSFIYFSSLSVVVGLSSTRREIFWSHPTVT